MTKQPVRSFRKTVVYGVVTLFTMSMLAFGQDPSTDPQSPPATGETQSPPPTADPQGPPAVTDPQAPPPAAEPQTPPPASPGWRRFSPPQSAPPEGPAPQADPAPPAVPAQITIPAGAFVTVRVDQLLSSDKNKAGDAFSASLARPLVANGFVVSRRGQTLGGRVVDAKKAGRVKGVSQLQITLNSLALADGQQVPIHTELTSITGTTSNGRDAAAVGATTVTGAAIGAAADWGTGAAIGAGAGLVAGVVGVLVTRGRPTIIYPESQLTFRLAAPVTFSTQDAPQAFAAVGTANPQSAAAQGPPQGPPPAGYACSAPGCVPPPPYFYGPYYPYPYFWGPSFGFFYGGGFYGRGWGFRR